MNKAQKAFFLFLASSFLIIFVLIGVSNYFKNSNKMIFYYGIGCPHCANVEDFMEKNGVESKLEIIKKEVYYSKTNAFELKKVAEKCGLDSDSIGVPLMYSKGKCYLGDEEIINFLKLNLQGVK